MASWDGSERAGPSDDPNYYYLARAINAAVNPRTWDYYTPVGNSPYPHESTGMYAGEDVNGAATSRSYRSEARGGLGVYVRPVDDNSDGAVVAPAARFFENNARARKLASRNDNVARYARANLGDDSIIQYPRGEAGANLAKRSTLHVGADEFVPNATSQKIGTNSSQPLYEALDARGNAQANGCSSSHVFFNDNRSRANEQRRCDDTRMNVSHRGTYGSRRCRNYERSAAASWDPCSNNAQAHPGGMGDRAQRGGCKRNARGRDNNHGRSMANEGHCDNRQQQRSRLDGRKVQGDGASWQNSEECRGDERGRNGSGGGGGRRDKEERYSSENHRGSGEHKENVSRGCRETSADGPRARSRASSNRANETSGRKGGERGGRARQTRDGAANPAGNRHFDKAGENEEREATTTSGGGSRGCREASTKRSRNEEPRGWRQRDNLANRGRAGTTASSKYSEKMEFDDDASQRERLTELLNQGRLECLICCDYVRQNDAVWSCTSCHHVMHLKCLKKWAHSSQSENGWRCPACQNVSRTIPEAYHCFCGKARAPEWNRRDVAHSCGDICGRSRARNNCVHKCTLLCHPGACPECIAMVTRSCGCGKTSQSRKCSATSLVVCDDLCEKMLNCRIHNCEKRCHHGDCGPCEKTVHQECHCGKHEREVACDLGTASVYGCREICEKFLDCGNHRCQETCHPGSCPACKLLPGTVTHCCCGQTALDVDRSSCLDPIPTCDKVCSKRLECGQPGDRHVCTAQCHPESCPECELTTKVRCRCGNMDREIACGELRDKAGDARCERKCAKKRSCGKHKCNQLCCIDIEHACPLPCSKTLNCGRHRCRLSCHKGRCQPCREMSFDELHCECGASVIYPPVACGTRRPTCERPCARRHPCGHEVLHNCHSDSNCPPCTVLTQRWCYGGHELRKAVPCHVNEISCGLPCGKPLSCGRHKCITLCHPGACEKAAGQTCLQPCAIAREMCGHACAAPCHDAKCPDTPCKETVKVTCTCGNRSMTRVCAENSREFQRIASGILASKMADMQLGHSVDLEEVFGQGAKRQNQLKTLECNDECKIIARNRRIALGLQIVNPDVSGKLMPRYTETMKQWAKKDPHFCQMVHERLSELVQLAKTSKQKSRSYSFDSMNRDKRNFIHESCEHFGCESQAYDQEPKRNVVATALRDKCWLPSYSLLEMLQRENGQRKVPRPMLNSTRPKSTLRLSEVLSSSAKASRKLQPHPPAAAAATAAAATAAPSNSSKSPEPEIDYFDFPHYKTDRWANM